jgi:hypothetical protein
MTAIFYFTRNCWVRMEVWDGAVRILDMPNSFVRTHWHVPLPIPTSSAVSWIVQRQSWQTSCWIRATVSGVTQFVGLPLCSLSSTDVHWSWTGHVVETHAYDSRFGPQRFVESLWGSLFPRLAQNMMHTCCSFLLYIVKITTGHVHDSKQTYVKTAHVHPAMCNLAHLLTRHVSSTIYLCFMLPQLLYIWLHQSGIFSIPPCIPSN